ncbi:MAG: CS domain-containing protein [Methanofollis sp.]|uniref:CS domain-containing protein n=1 Tax=Methanofollis sp. TaxID=2052835 RepID=UPI002609B3BA|nr:CS domain-containing protein [Methanofollis sp.]MDD4255204.1 CS domain-containing protein [Methanofollis sp.]
MPNNPYDEIFKSLAKILGEMTGENGEPPRIIGCTIIAGGGVPHREEEMPEDDDGIDYEVVEGEDCVYVTAEVPPEAEIAAEFGPREVTLTVGDATETIDFEAEIDGEGSSYSVNNGILDVVCRKAGKTA